MRSGEGGFLHPNDALAQIGVLKGMRVGDFGCGHGYFAVPLARLVGRGGKIYAVDVQAEPLEAVRSRARLEGAHNIEIIRANLEISGNSRIPDASLDLVVIANLLFQVQRKDKVLLEARRVLKDGGELALLDWEPGSITAPTGAFLLSAQDAKTAAEAAGFSFVKQVPVGDHHWGLLFSK